MDKIIYCNIVKDDSLPMVIQELINKQAEIVDWINGLKEPCPVCHGQGATTDHHDPCTECGGSGKVGG